MRLPTMKTRFPCSGVAAVARSAAPSMIVPSELFASAATEMLTTPDPNGPEGTLFGASLFPYLTFLYFVGYRGNRCPELALFGFKFLLAFVFGSIPAAIIAAACYNVTLADCDWAHGSAECLLAFTNLFIVIGFRQALRAPPAVPPPPPPPASETRLASSALPLLLPALLVALAAAPLDGDFFGLELHTRWLGGVGDLSGDMVSSWWWAADEPLNALSIPTWIIHVSSLVEWLAAMGCVWRYAAVTGNERWKGLTWGMLPLHTSGICACTYHVFYNAPSLAFLVPLQAALTCIGNTTAAYAAYRLAVSNGWVLADLATAPWLPSQLAGLLPPRAAASADGPSSAGGAPAAGRVASGGEGGEGGEGLVGFEDLADKWRSDPDYLFAAKLVFGCTAASYAVKYGCLALQPPFDDPEFAALCLVFVPSILNALKWKRRSDAGSSAADALF